MMESAAVQVIEALSDKLGIAVDWASDNVLPVAEELIQKYVTYIRINQVVHVSVSLLLSVVLAITVAHCTKKYNEIVKENGKRYYRNEECNFFIVAVFGSVFAVVTAIWFVVSIFSLIKAIYFPEAYILGLIANM